MNNLQEIRRENLISIIKTLPSAKALADKLGVSNSQISQHKSGTRPISDKLARKIEGVSENAKGWMDIDHSRLQTEISIELACDGVLDLVKGLRDRGFDVTALNDKALRGLVKAVLVDCANNQQISATHIESSLQLVESIIVAS